ncbi:hypothetical protein [Lactobacillus pasteurii]|uniref:DNA-binding protein n=1 Tax=Lactobacillus pasteurii DSM 23907 = CRBIP 24.76 TaxID=1423790 RepID=I7LDY6_9LACO|nr:hypothetical protein [Lactobacillus pasteurii]TDG76589.1 hypothetical protein C5L33_001348 [Lactobacillus pasteurii]CCI85318.1 Putative uncharacterized protein [Lactobacillus pasteurii DSM 23907 = CRBIP 24.76]
MEKTVTRNELMELKHYSLSTYYLRRAECLTSPYASALVFDGNRTLIKLDLWDKFIEWKSDNKKRELLGI